MIALSTTVNADDALQLSKLESKLRFMNLVDFSLVSVCDYYAQFSWAIYSRLASIEYYHVFSGVYTPDPLKHVQYASVQMMWSSLVLGNQLQIETPTL